MEELVKDEVDPSDKEGTQSCTAIHPVVCVMHDMDRVRIGPAQNRRENACNDAETRGVTTQKHPKPRRSHLAVDEQQAVENIVRSAVYHLISS